MRSIDAIREFLGKSPSVVFPQDVTQDVIESVVFSRDVIEYVDAMEREIEEGYVELPKDADGEYIHIGDRVEDNERVARIVLTDGSWEPSVYTEKLPGVLHEYFCDEIGHYHAPTVEDVLCEFALACEDAGNSYPDVARIASEYAAKFQLRKE